MLFQQLLYIKKTPTKWNTDCDVASETLTLLRIKWLNENTFRKAWLKYFGLFFLCYTLTLTTTGHSNSHSQVEQLEMENPYTTQQTVIEKSSWSENYLKLKS